ncbi:MAG: PEGA domain-containing protein, partial [Myxococcales bacterium]|nr:PEGA domain-containing protein [Myxococcales bacterium]
PGTGAAQPPVKLTAQELAATGFDLYVTPANVAAWRLDGDAQNVPLPAQSRGMTPGHHTVAIDAPPGFMSVSRDFEIKGSQVEKVVIELQPLDITGVFESDPPGAKVTLDVGGKRVDVGPTPARYKLDPTQKIEVSFEKDGYVAVTKPVTITGQPEEKIAVVLEAARVASGGNRPPHGGKDTTTGGGKDTTTGGGKDTTTGGGKDTTTGGGKDTTTGGGKDTTTGGGKDTSAKGEGVLSLGSKPPCDIYIDGKSTGLKTPQREIKLSTGRHKVTLMNNEFGIKESFTVEIKAGEAAKAVKDFSDRMTPP